MVVNVKIEDPCSGREASVTSNGELKTLGSSSVSDANHSKIVTVIDDATNSEYKRLLVEADFKPGVYLDPTPITRRMVSQYAVSLDLPAEIETTNQESYNVGGETLTLLVNDGYDNYTFEERSATKGIIYSPQNPPLTNGGEDHMKVRIDNGAEYEIEVAKNLTTYDLAAAIQEQIRANVENGTGVICEYNPVDYPGRYIIRSGSTGPTSTIWVKDDHMGKVLQLSIPSGATQVDGLNADTYYAFEVASALSANTDGVIVDETSDHTVTITTQNLGSSASLEVIDGGANTALGFPTTRVTGSTGTQSDDLAVNGAPSPVIYSIIANTEYEYNIEKIRFIIIDEDEKFKTFGGIAKLTNGIDFKIKTSSSNAQLWFNATTNSELIANTDSYTLMIDAFDGGVDMLVCVIKFENPIILQADTNQYLSITINDDLSTINSFQVKAEGWLNIK